MDKIFWTACIHDKRKKDLNILCIERKILISKTKDPDAFRKFFLLRGGLGKTNNTILFTGGWWLHGVWRVCLCNACVTCDVRAKFNCYQFLFVEAFWKNELSSVWCLQGLYHDSEFQGENLESNEFRSHGGYKYALLGHYVESLCSEKHDVWRPCRSGECKTDCSCYK